MASRNATRPRSGFTLIEVLVALVILAVALTAASRAARVATDSAQESRLHTLATWVAQNRIAELTASRAFPATGNTSGHGRMAGVEFDWKETVASTPNPGFRKFTIDVLRPADTQILVTLNAYLTQPGSTPTP
jgi:general secretion pathway protein I